MPTNINISKEDLDNIQNFLEEDMASFLVNNLTEFSHCLFIMQAVMDKITEAKEFFKNQKD